MLRCAIASMRCADNSRTMFAAGAETSRFMRSRTTARSPISFAEKDYGFIDAGGGTDVYFHRNAVADEGFDQLTVGDEVRFAIHPGECERGPQAFAVVPIGKHHLAPERP
jgi:cold shock CspA family protein